MIENFAALVDATAGLTQYAFNLLLQSTALIAVGLMVGWAMRRHGSAVQSAIYRATLVTVLACPFAAIALNLLGFQGWTFPVPSTHQLVTYEVSDAVAELDPPVPVMDSQIGDEPQFLPTLVDPGASVPQGAGSRVFAEPDIQTERLSASTPISISAISVPEPVYETRSVSSPSTIAAYCLISSIWIVGALFLVSRVIIAYRKLGMLRQQSSFADEAEHQVCASMAQRINVSSPEIRRNSLLSSPCLTGVLSPAILLPSEINERILLEKAFAHELGHLRRRDTLWNLIQRIALSLFFFQPLLWRLVYRLETTAEEVCDDYVVRHCQDRTGYAQQLVELAESNLLAPNMAGLGMFKTNRSMLGQRVVRILDSTRTLTTQISGPIVVTIISLAVVCATLGGFIGNGNRPFAVFTSTDSSTDDSEGVFEESMIKISGRVLDPEGSPVSNADVSVFPSVFSSTASQNPPPYTTTTSKRDGSFEVSFPKSSLIVSGTGFARERNYCVVVRAAGFGINWLDADDLKESAIEDNATVDLDFKSADLRLTPDKTKINLRLIDPEGNPVSGATARVTGIKRFKNENIEPFFQSQAKGEVYAQYSISDDLLIHGSSEFRANEKGELLVDGMGDNRIVKLEITGPGIAIRSIRVATKDSETVSVAYGGMSALKMTTYGSTSTITCESTQPIVGRVFDRESKLPLVGVKVMSSKFAGTNLAGINILQTESDVEGRFRLVGMPKGPGNAIIAVPNDDQPYFMLRFEVPSAPSLEPVEMDLPLQRGVFIRGKATNLKTGEPIAGAALNYLPFLSNDTAAASPVYADRQFMEIQNRYLTGLDGSFQLVGMPGRGIVGINVHEGYYPSGMGWEDIDESEKSNDVYGHIRTFRRPVTPSHLWPTAMQQVDLANSQAEQRVEFQLDPGLSIPVKIIDPDGQPLVGVNATRLRSRSDYSHTTTAPLLNATAFAKNETRLVKFEHPAKSLSLVVELNAAVLDSKGELANPIQIKLMPNSDVTGRLIDGNGDAIQGGEIRFDVGGSRNFGMMLSRVTTDENGKFSMENVPSGTHYSISVSTANGFFTISERLDVGAGESIDLGLIDVSQDDRPEPKRARQDAGVEKKGEPESESPDETIAFTGTVVDSMGIPVAGAKVYRNSSETTSGADGSFKLEIAKSETLKLKGQSMLFARKEGFGRAFCPMESDPATNSTEQKGSIRNQLVLPEDDHPIAGKLVDTEGNPIPGALIEIEYIHDLKSTSEYLAAAARNQATIRDLPRGRSFVDERFGKVHSDSQGMFSIKGVGTGRAVQLKIMGDNIAVTKPIVVTAKTESLAVYREAGMFGDQFGKIEIHGHQPTIVCEPTQVITGVVVDRETGEPLVGVDVYSDRFSDVPIGGIRDLKTTTDKEGRFRLSGMPVGPNNEISAFPPTVGEAAKPYLARDFAVPAANGLQPVDVRIELQRGQWVRGKVIDKKSGQPVAAARVTYKPYIDNELGEKLYSKSRIPHPIGFLETKQDGMFQIVALPGKALLDVWVVRAPYYPPGQGWEEIPDERKDNLGNILSQGYPSNQQHPTAMKEINVIAGQSIDDLVYELDPGKSILVKLQDPNGNPLQDVKIENASSNVSQDFYAKDQSEFQATGFLEGQRRTLTFYQKEKNLGQIQTIGEEVDSPVTVTLQPNAKVMGKLVNSDGDPLPRANIRFDLTENRNYFLKYSPFKYITDENGVFDQIAIPGRYKVQVETLDGFYVLDLGLDIPPGAQVDLGTLDVTAIHKKIMDELNGRVKNSLPQESESDDQGATTQGQEIDMDKSRVARPDYQIILNLNVDGKVRIAGQGLEKIKDLGPVLTREINTAAREGVVNPSDISVIISAHEDTLTELVQELISKCQAAKLENFKLRVNGKVEADPVGNRSAISSIQGTVVDENDRPISGADVELRLRYRPGLMAGPIAQTTTDTNGNFKIQYKTDSVSQYPRLQRDDFNTTIEVVKEGFARGWVDVCQITDAKTTVKLSSKTVDVELKLIDPEGNPIQGQVIAEISNISRFNQPLHKIILGGGEVESALWKAMPSSGRFYVDSRIKVESDELGRFQIKNLGENRLYWGRLVGSEIANRYFQFATGINSDLKYSIPSDDDEMGDEQRNIFATGAQIVCEPGQTVTGVVRDGETGEPISGVQLSGVHSPVLRHSIKGIFDGRTDAKGRFEISGLGVGGRNTLFAVKHADQPFVSRYIELPTTEMGDSLKFDFKMFRGGRINVQVVDAATSEPIPAARVFFAPLHANPANENYPEHNMMGIFGICPGETPLTNSDGKCELTGMIGQGIIGVRIHESKYRQGQGGEEITRVLGPKVFPPLGGIRDFVTTRHAVSSSVTAVKLIEVKNIDDITAVRVEIDTTPIK